MEGTMVSKRGRGLFAIGVEWAMGDHFPLAQGAFMWKN
jgi:hypothetical protein